MESVILYLGFDFESITQISLLIEYSKYTSASQIVFLLLSLACAIASGIATFVYAEGNPIDGFNAAIACLGVYAFIFQLFSSMIIWTG